MKKGFIMTGALVLVAVGAYFVSGTYAKYTSEVSKTGTATVAKWTFDTKNTTGTFDFTLDQTAYPNTLAAGKVAPGTSGHFDLTVSNEEAEVGVDVALNIGITGDNAPQNLKFYSDDAFANEITTSMNGQIAAGGTLPGTVYWKWAYETLAGYKANSAINSTTDWTSGTGDEVALGGNVTIENYALLSDDGKAKCTAVYDDAQDTLDGTNAGTVNVEVTIVGTQRQPGVDTTTGW